MSPKTREAMVRLQDACPFNASDMAASLTPAELEALRASIPTVPIDTPHNRRWASLSAPKRTAIVALVVGLLGAGGGLAAAAVTSHSTPTGLPIVRPTYPEAQRKVIYANLLKLATCMHAHGFPTFPDPKPNYGNGKVPIFSMGDTPSGGSTDMTSPAAEAALKQCTVGMQKVPGDLGKKAFPNTP